MIFLVLGIIFALLFVSSIIISINDKKYRELEEVVLKKLNFKNWNVVKEYDDSITVKSRVALEKYDDLRYFKDNKEKFEYAEKILNKKSDVKKILNNFLKENEFKEHSQYSKIFNHINTVLYKADAYRVNVKYITNAGNNLGKRVIKIKQKDINKFINDPSLLMSKGEYSKYLKEQEKDALSKVQHKYYDKINSIIDIANSNKDLLFIKGSIQNLDKLIEQLYDKTLNFIKRIKTSNSEEWGLVEKLINNTDEEIHKIINKNLRILEYYNSSNFLKIKETCEVIMSTQREFNEYISEKVSSISKLFGTRIVRKETINDDEYQYVRPYKKTITPFTAELSAAVFASAENNPLEYVIKNFYINKDMYPEQIQKLHLLIEELSTLKEAKLIIENYKKEYQQYLMDVPDYIMREDEDGFYSRLGFANIDESVLVVEYEFSYTSGGGMAKRTFTVPMTEETIIELIKSLENKLTINSFAKEQRALMTNRLREFIKQRDNFTCCNCGNSIHKEPNLLLEIDHIIPVSKGGVTVEENLQTLCWKCNRAKSNKILD